LYRLLFSSLTSRTEPNTIARHLCVLREGWNTVLYTIDPQPELMGGGVDTGSIGIIIFGADQCYQLT
jgi:hypothetical protein